MALAPCCSSGVKSTLRPLPHCANTASARPQARLSTGRRNDVARCTVTIGFYSVIMPRPPLSDTLLFGWKHIPFLERDQPERTSAHPADSLSMQPGNGVKALGNKGAARPKPAASSHRAYRPDTFCGATQLAAIDERDALLANRNVSVCATRAESATCAACRPATSILVTQHEPD